MTKLTQFLALLNNKLEDGEVKTELVSALENVATDVTTQLSDLKSQRKDVGKKLDSEKANLQNIAKSLGLDKDATIEDINEALTNMSTNNNVDLKDALETEKAKWEAKTQTQTEELRYLIAEKDNALNDISGKYQNLEFDNLIDNAGLMNGLSEMAQSNPELKKAYRNNLKSQLLVKDGNLFVNDGNGEVARNLTTNEVMTPDVVVSKLKDDATWQPFFKGEQKANGMGTPATQPNGGIYSQQTRSSASKIADGLSKL